MQKTYRRPIIPKRNIPRLPLKPRVNLGTRRHNLVQQANNVIALRLRYTNNLGHEPWIEENRFPARDGVCADQRVLGSDGVAAHGAAEIAGALGLELGGVEGCEGLEVLLHMRR
jgi:hypothetical protein